MAIAETAELAVLLKLKDELSGPLATTNARIKELESTSTGAATRGVGNLEKSVNSLGGALGHAKGKIGEILTGPLGFLGLAAGVLTFSGAIEHSISKAGEWGLTIEKLQGITGNTAEQLSGLLAVTEKYGVTNDVFAQSVAFTEKSLGKLAANGGANAKKFLDAYGFSISDAQGKTKTYSDLLLTFSDYWVKNTDAAQKAAAAAALFGRGYAKLVPVLNLGKQGIIDAEEEAKNLGLTLTQDNVVALEKAREATRKWGDALGGLELQIGLTLLPTITDLAQAATSFVSDNRAGIIGFFKDAAKFAGDLGAAVHDEVLPIFGAIKSAWMSVPAPLRNLILTGFVADKTIKFLFGFDPAKLALGTLFKGGLFDRGSPTNPMYVTGIGAGGLTGPGSTGGLGVVGQIQQVLPLAIIGTALASITNQIGKSIADALAGGDKPKGQMLNSLNDTGTQMAWGPFGIIATAPQRLQALFDFFDPHKPADYGTTPESQSLATFRAGERGSTTQSWGSLTSATKDLADAMRHPGWLSKLEGIWQKHGEVTRAQLALARSDVAAGRNLTTAAGFLGANVSHHGAGSGGPAFIRGTIHDLRAALSKTYDPGEIKAITTAIHQLRDRLPKADHNEALLHKAERIATSTKSTAEKIRELKAELKGVESPVLKGKLQDIIDQVPKKTGKDLTDVKNKLAQKQDDTRRDVTQRQHETTSAVQRATSVFAAAIERQTAALINGMALYQTIVTPGAVQGSAVKTNRYGPPNGSSGGGHSGRTGSIPT